MPREDLMRKRVFMHLMQMERDATCMEEHVQGVKQLYVLRSSHVVELNELIERIQAKIVTCQDEVFSMSGDEVPSSVLA